MSIKGLLCVAVLALAGCTDESIHVQHVDNFSGPHKRMAKVTIESDDGSKAESGK